MSKNSRAFLFSTFLLFLFLSDKFSRLDIDQQSSMEFFQEPTFTAFLALILSFVVAKIVSYAMSNSSTDDNPVARSINEGAVATEATLDRGLRVRSAKSKKRVKFTDDVVIRRVDRYEGSENLVLSVGDEAIAADRSSIHENFKERVDEFVNNEEQCFDITATHDADAQNEGSEKVEMLIEKKEGDGDSTDRVYSEKENSLLKSGVIVEVQKNELQLEGGDMATDQIQVNGVVGAEENEGLVTGDTEAEDRERKLSDGDEDDDDDDDDWEGIERSELEKVFAEAVNYLEYGGKGRDKEDNDHLAKLGSDVQMQLYGLHKVAVEGPCHEPQPMALKVSARAKWNAWQRLGSMSQEAAMEQYIGVLSDSVPGWMQHYSADDDIQGYSQTVVEISTSECQRKSDLNATPACDSSTDQSSVEKGSRFTAGAKFGGCSKYSCSLH